MLSRTAPRYRLNALLPLYGAVLIILALAGASIGAYRPFQVFCVRTVEIANAWLPLFPWVVLLVPLVVAGTAIASLAHQLLATHRLVHALLEDEVVPIDQGLRRAAIGVGIDHQVRLIASTEFFAFCYGLFRPMVCISTATVAELSSTELEAVLRHESWHLRRRDPLKVLVIDALGTALLLVPIVRDFARYYALTRELKADEDATRAMDDRRPLASALYRVAVTGTVLTPNGAVGAFNITDARIDQLLGEKPPVFRPGSLSAAVTVVAFLGLLILTCLSIMAANFDGMARCVRC